MLHELTKIPHPTWNELLVSGEVFFFLYPLRIFMHWFERAVVKWLHRTAHWVCSGLLGRDIQHKPTGSLQRSHLETLQAVAAQPLDLLEPELFP